MPSDDYVHAIGLYAKGWYGSFTGNSDKCLKDLKIIFSHIAACTPDCISDKDILIKVLEIAQQMILPRELNERIVEAMYPSFRMKYNDETHEIRLLNSIICGFINVPIKNFPNGDIIFDEKIAILFPNGHDQIQKNKEWTKKYHT